MVNERVLKPMRAKPPVGSALVFYNYGRPTDGKVQCDHRSEHRSVPVRSGTKAVLQRWYGFADQGTHQALARRAWDRHGPSSLRDPALRLPFQPVVKCNRLPDAAVSCRSYNRPGHLVYLEESRSAYRWCDTKRCAANG